MDACDKVIFQETEKLFKLEASSFDSEISVENVQNAVMSHIIKAGIHFSGGIQIGKKEKETNEQNTGNVGGSSSNDSGVDEESEFLELRIYNASIVDAFSPIIKSWTSTYNEFSVFIPGKSISQRLELAARKKMEFLGKKLRHVKQIQNFISQKNLFKFEAIYERFVSNVLMEIKNNMPVLEEDLNYLIQHIMIVRLEPYDSLDAECFKYLIEFINFPGNQYDMFEKKYLQDLEEYLKYDILFEYMTCEHFLNEEGPVTRYLKVIPQIYEQEIDKRCGYFLPMTISESQVILRKTLLESEAAVFIFGSNVDGIYHQLKSLSKSVGKQLKLLYDIYSKFSIKSLDIFAPIKICIKEQVDHIFEEAKDKKYNPVNIMKNVEKLESYYYDLIRDYVNNDKMIVKFIEDAFNVGYLNKKLIKLLHKILISKKTKDSEDSVSKIISFLVNHCKNAQDFCFFYEYGLRKRLLLCESIHNIHLENLALSALEKHENFSTHIANAKKILQNAIFSRNVSRALRESEIDAAKQSENNDLIHDDNDFQYQSNLLLISDKYSLEWGISNPSHYMYDSINVPSNFQQFIERHSSFMKEKSLLRSDLKPLWGLGTVVMTALFPHHKHRKDKEEKKENNSENGLLTHGDEKVDKDDDDDKEKVDGDDDDDNDDDGGVDDNDDDDKDSNLRKYTFILTSIQAMILDTYFNYRKSSENKVTVGQLSKKLNLNLKDLEGHLIPLLSDCVLLRSINMECENDADLDQEDTVDDDIDENNFSSDDEGEKMKYFEKQARKTKFIKKGQTTIKLASTDLIQLNEAFYAQKKTINLSDPSGRTKYTFIQYEDSVAKYEEDVKYATCLHIYSIIKKAGGLKRQELMDALIHGLVPPVSQEIKKQVEIKEKRNSNDWSDDDKDDDKDGNEMAENQEEDESEKKDDQVEMDDEPEESDSKKRKGKEVLKKKIPETDKSLLLPAYVQRVLNKSLSFSENSIFKDVKKLVNVCLNELKEKVLIEVIRTPGKNHEDFIRLHLGSAKKTVEWKRK